jgi:hypothetical protein
MRYCKYCNAPLSASFRGRMPLYCGGACRQAHYRLRQSDFVHVRVSRRLRSIIDANFYPGAS